MAQLICLGTSYKTASLDLRERIAPTDEKQQRWSERLLEGDLPGVEELVILSTCNRTELYAVGEAEIAVRTLRTLIGNVELYEKIDDACIDHLMCVAAGLDSQVIGEPQILGQLINAFETATARGTVGTILSTLMRSAIRAGKRVRTETELSRGALSISSIAARHADQLTGSLNKSTVLVIGAGKMARSAVDSFSRRGIGKLIIVNRTFDHAQKMAAEYNAEALPYNQLFEALITADVVLAAATSPKALIFPETLSEILPKREGRALLMFDIALPRNIEPKVGTIPGVSLYNLDDLEAVAETHRAERQSAIPQAASIISEESQLFMQWQASRSVVPVIQGLRAQAETVRQAELAHLIRRLPTLSDHDLRLLEDFSSRLINKMLHQPVTRLKAQSAQGNAELYANIVDDLFGLQLGGTD